MSSRLRQARKGLPAVISRAGDISNGRHGTCTLKFWLCAQCCAFLRHCGQERDFWWSSVPFSPLCTSVVRTTITRESTSLGFDPTTVLQRGWLHQNCLLVLCVGVSHMKCSSPNDRTNCGQHLFVPFEVVWHTDVAVRSSALCDHADTFAKAYNSWMHIAHRSCCCTHSCDVLRSSWWPFWFWRTSKCCGESACIVPDPCDWQGTPHSRKVLEINGVECSTVVPIPTSLPKRAEGHPQWNFTPEVGRPRLLDVGSPTVWMFPNTGMPCLEVTVKRGCAKSQWSWTADSPAKLVLPGVISCIMRVGRFPRDVSFLRRFIPEFQQGHCASLLRLDTWVATFLICHVVSGSAKSWSCSCPGFWTHSNCWHVATCETLLTGAP